MRTYLNNLIAEKRLGTYLEVDGHIGFTYDMLIDAICAMPAPTKRKIRMTLVKIDFANGDVDHFLHYIARGLLNGVA